MNTAQIARWCNEIERIILEIYNTNRLMQFDECKKMLSKLKAIGAEISTKPITNGDKIRSMTDEELAEFLCLVKDKLCFACAYTRIEDCTGIPCENARLEWLRKEVSEDADD